MNPIIPTDGKNFTTNTSVVISYNIDALKQQLLDLQSARTKSDSYFDNQIVVVQNLIAQAGAQGIK